MLILVVEDTVIAQIMAKTFLIKEGFDVDVVSNGTTAIEMADATYYDLILMDIGLGDGPDGFETTAAIKEKSKLNKNTPVIALTAHSDPEYKQKAISIGMVDYFNKPFTREDAKKITNYLKIGNHSL